MKKKLLYSGVALIIAVAIVIGIKNGWFNKSESIVETQEKLKSANISVPVETIGEILEGETSQMGTSWPGEIISSGDVEVQPQREGTIVEWKVKIGQQVKQGQVLARLSAPPATPELSQMLAEQAESYTKAKASAEAEAVFVEKNKQQLNNLREQIVSSAKQISNSLSDDSSSDKSISLARLEASLYASRKDLQVKTQSVKDYSSQAVRKIFTQFTNYSGDPLTLYKQNPQNFYFNLRSELSVQSSNFQTEFNITLAAAVKAILNDDESIGEKTIAFLQSTDAVVANSYTSTELIATLRDVVSDERAELSEKLKDLTEARIETAKIESDLAAKKTEFSLTTVTSNKETAEKLKDIDEKLIDLDRQLQLARAEAQAAGVAYSTIAGALTGGLNIIAPRAGIVSIILKKNGDFVSPGTAVASINSGNNTDRLVRFRVPGNIIPPQAGEILTVIRPGYEKDGKKIKLSGIGISLDGNGSFLADADFVDPVDWPVHGSVRVLPSAAQANQILVSLSSVWWDEDGHANVWLVNEENKIRPQEVKTGRTLGDKIEILEGLQQGIRIISQATAELKTGMQLDQLSGAQPQTGEQPEGDGHGHTHEE